MEKNLSEIKVIFSDVDGTLTDGRLYYTEAGETMKVFHVKDGHGIKAWQAKKNTFGVITARNSPVITTRMKELGVENILTGSKDKRTEIENWLKTAGLEWKHLAYIGDDLNDLPLLEAAGFSAAPSDAALDILEKVDYVCDSEGGHGAVREFIDFLLENDTSL